MSKKIQKALELINKGKFEAAEALLLEMKMLEESTKVTYLLGLIHHINIDNPLSKGFRGSKEEARRCFECVVDSNQPIEEAFWRLAVLADNKKHAARILRKGVKKFPGSKVLYEHLLINLDDSEIRGIYEELKKKRLASNTLNFRLFEFFWRQKDFSESLKLISGINPVNSNEAQLLDLIKAFCIFEIGGTTEAKTLFQKLLDDDVSQKLNYAQHIGFLLCLLKLKRTEDIVLILDELPNKLPEPYIYIHTDLNFEFTKYFDNLITELEDYFKSDKELKSSYAKIRGFRALSECDYGAITNKVLIDLKFARNNSKDKKIYDIALVIAYLQTGKVIEAFIADFKNLEIYDDYESEIGLILEESDEKESEEILKAFSKKLSSLDSWERRSIEEPAKIVIKTLHEREDYEELLNVVKYFSDDELEKMDVLFEAAYAYGKLSESEKSKKFYEKIWKKEQTSSAVANNLALLYENEADYYSAVDLFKKAMELDPEDEIAPDNLERVKKKISDEISDIEKWEKDQDQALKDIAKENLYIHGRLSFLIDKEDSDKNIVASYSKLCEILKASPEKVQELIAKFLEKKYIYKIVNHDVATYSNVYRVNYAVRDFILDKKKRIEINKAYSEIGEKISIDSIENLGLDDELLAIVSSKVKDKELEKILKRDLKENIFALLTESHKTALVLSGSIIESFIFNKISESGITKSFPNARAQRNKKVVDMNLSELLYVAGQNNIVEVQLYHFSQALKHYRNFIHPAVEIRKGKIKKITKDDAELAWRITKKIIKEI